MEVRSGGGPKRWRANPGPGYLLWFIDHPAEAIEHCRDHGYANQTSQSSGSGGLPGFEGSGVGPVLEELCLAFKGYGGACRRAPLAGGLRGLG
jgi:hypothetical protein